ncbi:hypothetical protein KOW79_018585 [Hemibagrus wyckioides]|uniref:Uncharacterized protein n=1 Tax=Hemibagrus wyckioides TaxID=337641 RepID=A0A9D3NAK2_9TELE|nr:hypothetical protein KOW79_018585 [Hemibagrus wyckioides]
MASLVLDSFIRHRQVNESTSPLDVERLATKPRLIRACLALRTETKAHSPAPLNAFMLLSTASLWSRGCAINPFSHSSLLPSRFTHAPWQPSSTSTTTTTSTSGPTASPLLLMALCQRSRRFARSGTRALSSLPDSLLSCYMLQSRKDACKQDEAHTPGRWPLSVEKRVMNYPLYEFMGACYHRTCRWTPLTAWHDGNSLREDFRGGRYKRVQIARVDCWRVESGDRRRRVGKTSVRDCNHGRTYARTLLAVFLISYTTGATARDSAPGR